ncbi:hypothetical protein [Paenibacillus woosongensis]
MKSSDMKSSLMDQFGLIERSKQMTSIINPVIRGFNPDASMIRVGG